MSFMTIILIENDEYVGIEFISRNFMVQFDKYPIHLLDNMQNDKVIEKLNDILENNIETPHSCGDECILEKIYQLLDTSLYFKGRNVIWNIKK